MRRFAVICNIEMKLFIRDFFGFFFTLIFPALMLLLFGSIYGNDPVSAWSDMGTMDMSVPAYSVMVIGVTGLVSFPLTLANCKEKKIYKRYDASPVGKTPIIFAQVLSNFIMTLIGICILLVLGKILYHIRILGTFPSISCAVLLSTAAMFSIGFLFTAIGRDIRSTNLLCYLFYFIMLYLSGATIPDMFFPDTIQKISAVLPMTHAVDLMQGVFTGDSLSLHGKELLVLGTVTVICTIAGGALYRNKDWT